MSVEEEYLYWVIPKMEGEERRHSAQGGGGGDVECDLLPRDGGHGVRAGSGVEDGVGGEDVVEC